MIFGVSAFIYVCQRPIFRVRLLTLPAACAIMPAVERLFNQVAGRKPQVSSQVTGRTSQAKSPVTGREVACDLRPETCDLTHETCDL
jgi:hypothetical protein